MISIPLKLIDSLSSTPAPSRKGDAGLDLISTISCDLEPFERTLIPTGVSIAIPEGYAGLVVPRSGLAANHGITVLNSPGLIDSNYRGEIHVILINLDNHETYQIKSGDRIAQLLFIKVESPVFDEVEELPCSNRGGNGFGSSGY